MVYELSRIIARIILILYFRFRVYGRKNIIGAKGGIIAVNHTSFLDPILVGVPIPGRIFYVAKKQLLKNRLVRWYLKKLNVIPIDRDKPDLVTLKRMIKMIMSGELVVMFPEGTRSINGRLGEARRAVGLLAARSRATIYPCYIMGAVEAMPKEARFFRPGKIRMVFGRPVRYDDLYDRVPTKRAYEEISRSIMAEIAGLQRKMEREFSFRECKS